MINDLCCPVTDVIHPLHPLHLILRFELFGDPLTFGHLLCQQEHLFRCLFVDVGKVCHRLPIATPCYILLWVFLALAFALMSCAGFVETV